MIIFIKDWLKSKWKKLLDVIDMTGCAITFKEVIIMLFDLFFYTKQWITGNIATLVLFLLLGWVILNDIRKRKQSPLMPMIAHQKESPSFISLKEAAGTLYEQLRTADFLPTSDRTHYSVYHLLESAEREEIALYGEKSPSTLQEKIPVSIISQRCLDRAEFDRFCFPDGRVDYQNLSVTKDEFESWLKTQEPYDAQTSPF